MLAVGGDLPAAPWLRRAGLVERLAELADDGGVAILAAEPGAGKSVLLAQWLADREEPPAAWIAGDVPDELRGALGALARPDALVVVDQAEALTGEQLATVGRAAATRADGAALVLAGRHDPGLCRLELAATGPVLDLDGEDLAFTPEEVRRVLRLWSRWIPADQADAVAWATEGWCAGVRLAAVVGPQVLGDEAGALRHHLLEQTLIDAPRALRDAVVALAVADRFDAATVTAVLGPGEDAGALLDLLRRRRLFLRPAGEPGSWRLHRLFRAAALEQLEAGPPAATLELHRRVARHALSTGSSAPGRAAEPQGNLADAMVGDELLAAHAVELLLDARLPPPSASALTAAAAAPAQVRAALELALLAGGDPASAAPLQALPGAGDETARAAALLRARHAGDRPAAEAAAIALARAPAGSGRDALAWLELAALEHDLGAYVQAEDHALLAAAQAEHAGRGALAARAWATLAQIAASTGRIADAERHAAAAAGAADLPTEGAVRAGLARAAVAFFRDRLDDAARHVGAARHAAGASRDPVLWFAVLLWEVTALEAQGLDDRAAAGVAEAQDVLARCPYVPGHEHALDLYRVRLLDRAGRGREADAILARVAEHEFAAADLVIARRRLAADDAAGALAALRPRLAEARVLPQQLSIWHLLTYALIVDRLGEADEAHRMLETALDLAVPDGVRRPFADDAARAQPLLERHLRRETQHAAFVTDLVDHLRDARPAPEGRLTAPLTERERVVLGYLPTPMTAGEIAEALTVSEATVRTHLRHIYEKLGAHGRREAVRRARELRFLAPGRD